MSSAMRRHESWRGARPGPAARVARGVLPRGPGAAGRIVAACALALVLADAASAVEQEVRLAHSFTGGMLPDLELVVRAIPGRLEQVGPERLVVDTADYSRAGTLVVRRPVLLGPSSTSSALVPPGEYDLVVEGTFGDERLRVLVVGADGQRLAVPMVAAARPGGPVSALSLEDLGGSGGAWTVALHAPRASGMFVLSQAGDPGAAALEASVPGTRRSRGGAILERYSERPNAPARRTRRDRTPPKP